MITEEGGGGGKIPTLYSDIYGTQSVFEDRKIESNFDSPRTQTNRDVKQKRF